MTDQNSSQKETSGNTFVHDEQRKDEADNGIIKAIANITPWHGTEVKAVFDRCNSYDLTLWACENAHRLNVPRGEG